jgi:hypothetical protein
MGFGFIFDQTLLPGREREWLANDICVFFSAKELGYDSEL